MRKRIDTYVIDGCRKIPHNREQFIDIAFDEKVRKNTWQLDNCMIWLIYQMTGDNDNGYRIWIYAETI